MRNTSGVNKLSDTLAFAAYTPGRTAVDDAIQRFNPVTVAYHQVRTYYGKKSTAMMVP